MNHLSKVLLASPLVSVKPSFSVWCGREPSDWLRNLHLTIMAAVYSEELGIPQLPGAEYPVPYMGSSNVLFTDLGSVGLH